MKTLFIIALAVFSLNAADTFAGGPPSVRVGIGTDYDDDYYDDGGYVWIGPGWYGGNYYYYQDDFDGWDGRHRYHWWHRHPYHHRYYRHHH